MAFPATSRDAVLEEVKAFGKVAQTVVGCWLDKWEQSSYAPVDTYATWSDGNGMVPDHVQEHYYKKQITSIGVRGKFLRIYLCFNSNYNLWDFTDYFTGSRRSLSEEVLADKEIPTNARACAVQLLAAGW